MYKESGSNEAKEKDRSSNRSFSLKRSAKELFSVIFGVKKSVGLFTSRMTQKFTVEPLDIVILKRRFANLLFLVNTVNTFHSLLKNVGVRMNKWLSTTVDTSTPGRP